MDSQLTRGATRRLLYVENKSGSIDGANARIGWATFSRTGQSVYYRDKVLKKTSRGIRGNFYEETTGAEYWVSGVKKRGSNGHWAEAPTIVVDDDAREEYERIRSQ